MPNAVLIIPDAQRDEANAYGASQGWGDNNFSVALSPSGALPATHWGGAGGVSQSFVDSVLNPTPETQPLISYLIYSFEDNVDPYTHWITTLTANGLAVVYPSEV